MDKRTDRFLLIGVIWVGLVFGIAFFSLVHPGITTRWKQEQATPEQAFLLKLGGQGEVLAQTASGNLYEFTDGSNPAWEKVTDRTADIETSMSCFTGNTDYLVFPPPGKVVSRVSENCISMDSGYHLEVAMMENGEIWSWKYEGNAYTTLLLPCFLLIAFVLGAPLLLLGLGRKIYQRGKKNQSRAMGCKPIT